MFQWLVKLFSWLRSLWEKLPPETKRKIIDAAIEGFKEILRAFWRWSQKPATDAGTA